jgi:transcriptional activator SPT8
MQSSGKSGTTSTTTVSPPPLGRPASSPAPKLDQPKSTDGMVSETSPVYSLAVHSEAQWILSGSRKGGIFLYSGRVDEGKCVATLQGHQDVVSYLAINHDETKVLSGSWDSKILV